jgi:hypothetical protein
MKKLIIIVLCLLPLTISIKAQINLQYRLVAYYPFNENPNDQSGNGNNGIIHKTPKLTNDRFGNPMSAFSFSAGDLSYITIPFSPTINSPENNDKITICQWVKLNSLGNFFSLLNKYEDTNYNGWEFLWINDSLSFRFASTNLGDWEIIKVPCVFESNKWYFVSFTYDKQGGTAKFYVDGLLIGSVPSSAEIMDLPYGDIYLGYSPVAAIPQPRPHNNEEYFTGEIDDISIYNRALNQQEIQALFNNYLVISKNTIINGPQGNSIDTIDIVSNVSWSVSSNQDWLKVNITSGNGDSKIVLTATANPDSSSRVAKITISGTGVFDQTITYAQDGSLILQYGLVAFYPFNGNTKDESGNLNNGSVIGATLAPDRFGNPNSAYNFNGIDNNIVINYVSGNRFESQYSIAMWINSNAIQTQYAKLFCAPQSLDSWNFPYHYLALTRNSLELLSGYFNTSAYVGGINTPEVTPDSWQQIVYTFKAGEEKLYVNGIMKSTNESGNSQLYFPDTISIGSRSANPVNNDEFFKGEIDDIRLYNRTLNASEIQTLFTGFINISTDSMTIAAQNGSSNTFEITSNTGWTIASNQNWLNISTQGGSGIGTITISATENPTTAARTATVRISGNGLEDQLIIVTQNGSLPFLSVSTDALTIGTIAVSTVKFEIISNISWTASGNQNWLLVSSENGIGSSTITLTAEENLSGAVRTAKITISATGLADQTVTVTQGKALTALAGTDITGKSFTANWDAVYNAASYKLDVSADNFASFIPGYENLTVSGTSAIITGLVRNTAYRYRVKAFYIAPAESGLGINPTQSAVVTDGIINASDPWESDKWVDVSLPYPGNLTSNMTAKFQLMYDVSNLYFAAQVSDSNRFIAYPTAYLNDCIEFFIDLDTTSGSGAYKPFGTKQLRLQAGSDAVIETIQGVPGSGVYKCVDNGFGYVQEWTMPWAELSNGMNPPWDQKSFKFDLQVANATSFGARTQQMFWNSNSDLQWNNTTKLGLVSLNKVVISANSNEISVTTQGKDNQSITFEALLTKTFGEDAFLLGGTSSSLLLVSYSSSNEAVAKISDNKVTIIGAGSATITASQPGNIDFNAATPVEQLLVVNKAIQLINFNAIPAKLALDSPFTLVAGSNSSLPLSFSSSNTSVATISGDTVTIVGVGTSIITASQQGNQNYLPAADVQQTLTVNPVSQSITFAPITDQTDKDGTVNLTASSNSGLVVVYDVSGPATINGTILTLTGAGKVIVTASQPGNDAINAAVPVSNDFCVNPLPVIRVMQTTGVTVVLLESNYPTGNQWLEDGIDISGSTNTSFDPIHNGIYGLKVTIDGCVGLSENVDVVISSLRDPLFSGGLILYPNPAKSSVFIQGLEKEDRIIRIYATSGKIMKELKLNSTAETVEMKIAELASDVYIVEVTGGTKCRRIVMVRK